MTRTTTLGRVENTHFERFASGVAAIAAEGPDGPDAMVVSSFTVGASFDPPMVTFAAKRDSATWQRLRSSDALGVSVLASAHGAQARRLSSRTRASRFDGVEHTRTPAGAVLIDGAPLHLECVVHREVEAGDHVVVLLQVVAAGVDEEASPLVYHGARFHSLQAIG